MNKIELKLKELSDVTEEINYKLNKLSLPEDLLSFPLITFKRGFEESCVPLKYDHDKWRTDRWVGFFHVDDYQVVIEPRIGWRTFFRLVALAHDITYFGEAEGAGVYVENFSRNILSLLWVKELSRARSIHKGVVKGYITREENKSPALRGRLTLKEQMHNQLTGKAHYIACKYRELSYDIPINRGILSVIHYQKKKRLFPFGYNLNINYLQDLLGWESRLLSLGVSRPDHFPNEKIHWNRTNAGYKRVHNLGEFITRGKGSAFREGKREAILFDSAEVWELFLLRLLKDIAANNDIRVVSPRIDNLEIDYLFESDKYGLIGGLIPDYLFYRENRIVLVLDAKYRIFTRDTLKEIVPQIALYICHYLPKDVEQIDAVLLFPKLKVEDNEFNSECESDEFGYYKFGSKRIGLKGFFIDISQMITNEQQNYQLAYDEIKEEIKILLKEYNFFK